MRFLTLIAFLYFASSVPSAEASSAQPFSGNDHFENAIEIENLNGVFVGSNLGATKQLGEPNHIDNKNTSSVWWRLKSAQTGYLTLSTSGSDFDTLIAVYQGTQLSQLGFVAVNDDEIGFNSSKLYFLVKPNEEFYIVVDGVNGAKGNITLSLTFLPPAERYEITEAGVVVDNDTGLMWARCAHGQELVNDECLGNPTHSLYKTALLNTQSSTLAGYADWRLPTAKELASLIYCSSGDPAYFLDEAYPEIVGVNRSCNGIYRKPLLNDPVFPIFYLYSDGGFWSKSETDDLANLLALSFTVRHWAGIWLRHDNSQVAHTRLVRDIPNAQVKLNITILNRQASIQGQVKVDTGKSCAAKCSFLLSKEQEVTVEVIPPAGAEFLGWRGVCQGNNNLCVIKLDRAKELIAEFSSVRFVDNKDGTITDSHNNLMWMSCYLGQEWQDGRCVGAILSLNWQQAFNHDVKTFADYQDWTLPTVRQLKGVIKCSSALPVFYADDNDDYHKCESRWDNDASGFFQMGAIWSSEANERNARYLTSEHAQFSEVPINTNNFNIGVRLVRKAAILPITLQISGDGEITSMPWALQCFERCSASFVEGQNLNLYAIPKEGYYFKGWQGACIGKQACVVKVLKDLPLIRAEFAPLHLGTINSLEFDPKYTSSKSGYFYSSIVLPSGFTKPVMVSVENGEVSVNCSGNYTAVAVLLMPGSTLCVRQKKIGKPGTVLTSEISIAGSQFKFINTIIKKRPKLKVWLYLDQSIPKL